MDKIKGYSVSAGWYNPGTGESTKIGKYLNSGEVEFMPNGISRELSLLKTGRGCDWVLVLDDSKSKK
jgi:hypothetical protein